MTDPRLNEALNLVQEMLDHGETELKKLRNLPKTPQQQEEYGRLLEKELEYLREKLAFYRQLI